MNISDDNPEPPAEYAASNERRNDPWDHDAVCWVLDRLDPGSGWTYAVFFECARKQPNRKKNDPDRVIEAAHICGSLGVDQLDVYDPAIGKTVVRLRRSDPDAPTYPAYYEADAGARMKVSPDQRAAAKLLLLLLPAYKAELVAAKKSPNTVETYTDRTERFLKRVANDDGDGSTDD
jgi:hypothetical protein